MKSKKLPSWTVFKRLNKLTGGDGTGQLQGDIDGPPPPSPDAITRQAMAKLIGGNGGGQVQGDHDLPPPEEPLTRQAMAKLYGGDGTGQGQIDVDIPPPDTSETASSGACGCTTGANSNVG